MSGEKEHQEEPGSLPLSPTKVKVTHFNRKVIALAAGLLCGVTAIAVIYALSPKKENAASLKAQQQKEETAQNADNPRPAECVTAGPKSYGEARLANAIYTTNGAVPGLGPPLNAWTQQPQNPPSDGNYTYVATPATGGAVLSLRNSRR